MKLLFLLSSPVLLSSSAMAYVSSKNTAAFVTPHHHMSPSDTALRSTLTSGVIKGEDENAAPYDDGLGGVRLAQENAVKVVGSIKHKPGKATPVLSDLVRYSQLRPVDEATMTKAMKEGQAKLVCSGQGTENYKDPGETAVAEIILAPMAAVRDALISAGSVKDSSKIVLNVLGGDDMQLLEVTDALVEMVLDLDCNTKADIEFNSVSHNSFPDLAATITVMAVDGTSGESTGVEKSVAGGEVYLHDGKYFTTVEEDINGDVA